MFVQMANCSLRRFKPFNAANIDHNEGS